MANHTDELCYRHTVFLVVIPSGGDGSRKDFSLWVEMTDRSICAGNESYLGNLTNSQRQRVPTPADNGRR